MPSHIVWGLQHLKRELRGSKQEEFAELEENILDLLHCQHLFPEKAELEDEIAELLQQCDSLARTYTPYTLEDLCRGQPAARFGSRIAPRDATRSALETVHPDIGLPDVQMQLLTHQVPISYCYQKNANPKDYPLVTLIIDTTRLQMACTAIVDVYFEKYGSSAPHQLIFPAGQVLREEFLPAITKEQMQQINEKCPATIRVTIHYRQPTVFAWEDSRQVYLLSYNTAMLWRYRWDRSLDFRAEYLAAWVTPRAPEVQKLLGEAVKYHPEQTFQGYNFPDCLSKEAQKREVRKIVCAIFEVLHRELEVRYITSALLTPSAAEPNMQCLQWVRLPKDSIAARSANCLDGSVLFASLLEQASLHPALLLLPGHAIVGWRVLAESEDYEFLETTLIAQGDFEQACQQGQKWYIEARLKGVLGKKPHFLIEDYAILIDIEECRAQNIVPM
jgi:hypothetical protein